MITKLDDGITEPAKNGITKPAKKVARPANALGGEFCASCVVLYRVLVHNTCRSWGLHQGTRATSRIVTQYFFRSCAGQREGCTGCRYLESALQLRGTAFAKKLQPGWRMPEIDSLLGCTLRCTGRVAVVLLHNAVVYAGAF